MWKSAEGSTARLIQLALGMFMVYTIVGVATKAFTSPAVMTVPVSSMSFLVWSTLGSTLICLGIIFAAKWYRTKSDRTITVGPITMPAEYAYIIPSGIMTAIIIPSTTLLYILLKSVMVAMVIMRASVIISSRLVDTIQIRQGILKKAVYWQENVAVVFAILAALTQMLLATSKDFDFLHNKAALIVMGFFVAAYAIRIYIMNYYRNTRPKGSSHDSRWFFSIEQFSASTTLYLALLVFALLPSHVGAIVQLHTALAHPDPHWLGVSGAGVLYGLVALFSIFIFMFKGRTATFSGLAYSQTSLAAGTTATLASAFIFHANFPSIADWSSLGLIVVAFIFLALAEKRRVEELTKTHELELVVPVANLKVAAD